MIALALVTVAALALSRAVRPAEHAVGLEIAPDNWMTRYRKHVRGYVCGCDE